MAGQETIASLVEGMNLEGDTPNGEPSSEPETSPSEEPGDGADDPGDGDPKSDDKPGSEGKPEGGPGSDAKGTPGTEGDEPAEPDAGYVADEVEEEPTVDPKTEELTANSSGLTPELQYVVDRLPALTVRGKDKTYQIKAAGQLPEDFEFATKREELVFNQALAAQEIKAQNLLNEYQAKQQQETFSKYNQQENEGIRHDIGDLQRENELPRFKYLPTDKRFNDDPAVKAVQEVMDYMNQKNEDYTKAKRPYRITFRDAYDQLATQIRKSQTESPAQKKEDAERANVSRRTGAGRTTPSNQVKAPVVARNMEELMSRIDSFDFA